MFGLGLPEIGIVLVIAVLFLGPSKLPELGKSLGGAISGFRKSLKEQEKGINEIEKTEHHKI